MRGTIRLATGLITDIQPGRTHAPGALDMVGDMLIPGAVDLHTDNLERQVEPAAARAGQAARRFSPTTPTAPPLA
jgi:alpha-D-ribose 1-methylphosphonate 5-triphosphate diphosphatase